MSSCITLTLPGELMFTRVARETAVSIADLVAEENRQESPSQDFADAFELAVSEAFTNSVTHAGERESPQLIMVTFEFEPPQLTVSVRDANEPFTIETPAPDIESFPESGFG